MRKHNLADELEDGALRNELFGPKSVARLPEPAFPHTYKMQFTGDGSEYFRIWIVNLLLTLLTLGIYSAWAKVRKTRYFWQNTRLDGAVFDYHGPPMAILRGRAIAVVLLVAYTWGMDISITVAFIVIGVLLLTGPWLFLKAQQFKFGNTTYRGLRFGFATTAGVTYRRLLPLVAIWFAPTVLILGFGLESTALLIFAALGTSLLFPWMHHELKAYQHSFANYGDKQFSFISARHEFYRTYAKGIGLMIVAGIVAGIAFGVLMTFASDELSGVYVTISGVTVALIFYTAVWPYLAARLQKIVWDHTSAPAMRFSTEIEAMPLFRLVVKNVGLTLLTLGLYWPWAAIALARYRVECFVVQTDVPMAAVARGVATAPTGAAGEGASDFFGLDVGL